MIYFSLFSLWIYTDNNSPRTIGVELAVDGLHGAAVDKPDDRRPEECAEVLRGPKNGDEGQAHAGEEPHGQREGRVHQPAADAARYHDPERVAEPRRDRHRDEVPGYR